MANNKVVGNENLKTYHKDLLKLFAKQDGYYDEMGVGVADNLKASLGLKTNETFLFQASANGGDIETSVAFLNTLNGQSYVFNQLVDGIDLETSTISGITFTNNGDGSFTLNGTATEDIDKNFEYTYRNVYSSHKYLLRGCANGGGTTTYALKMLRLDNLDIGNGVIANANSDGASRLNIIIKSGITLNNLVFYPQLFDLTLMFGTGKEPTTVVEFNKLFRENYYNYNQGIIISSKPQLYKIVGYNALSLDRTLGDAGGYNKTNKRLWDENKYYVGLSASNYCDKTLIGDFSISDNSVSFLSKQNGYGTAFPIKALPATNYTIEFNVSDDSSSYRISFYKKDGTFISYVSNQTFTTPNDCYWVVVVLIPQTVNQITTFSNICLHLTWSSSKTGYEPYYSKTYNLPNIELKSARYVYDILDSKGTLTRKIGAVDLGTLDWEKQEVYQGAFSSQTLKDVIRIPNNMSTIANIICSKYITSQFYNLADKTIAIDGLGKVYIRDTTFTDVTALKTALSGVIMYYELKTYETSDVSSFVNITKIDDYGTQEFISENNYPCCADFFYQINLQNFLQRVYLRTDGNAEDIALSDTKNTVGATNNINQKMFLVGTKEQTENPQSYTNEKNFIDTDNSLHAEKIYSTTENLKEPEYTNSNIKTLTSVSRINQYCADRFVGIKADAIIIETSIDGGETWQNAGLDDDHKRMIFNHSNTGSATIPLVDGKQSELARLRITLTFNNYKNIPENVPETEKINYWIPSNFEDSFRYGALNYFWFWIANTGNKTKITVQKRINQNLTNWIDVGVIPDADGLDGANTLSCNNFSFGGNGSANVSAVRFIFQYVAIPNKSFDATITSSNVIKSIRAFGYDMWKSDDYLAKNDTLVQLDNLYGMLLRPGNLVPFNNGVYNSGSTSHYWKNVYAQNYVENGISLSDKYQPKFNKSSKLFTLDKLDILYDGNYTSNYVTKDTEQNITGRKQIFTDLVLGKPLLKRTSVSEPSNDICRIEPSDHTNSTAVIDNIPILRAPKDLLYGAYLNPNFDIRASYKGNGESSDSYDANLGYTEKWLNFITDGMNRYGWRVLPEKITTSSPGVIQIKSSSYLGHSDTLALYILGYPNDLPGNYSGFLDDYKIEICTDYTNDVWVEVVNRTEANDNLGKGLLFKPQLDVLLKFCGIRLTITKCHVTDSGYKFINIDSIQLIESKSDHKLADYVGAVSSLGGDYYGNYNFIGGLNSKSMYPLGNASIGSSTKPWGSVYAYEIYNNGTKITDIFVGKTDNICSINGQSIKYGGSYTISGGGSSETITKAWCLNDAVSTADAIWSGDIVNHPENLVIVIQALHTTCTVNINCSSAQLEQAITLSANEEVKIMIYAQGTSYFNIVVKTTSQQWSQIAGSGNEVMNPEITTTGPHIVTYYRED